MCDNVDLAVVNVDATSNRVEIFSFRVVIQAIDRNYRDRRLRWAHEQAASCEMWIEWLLMS